MKREKKERWRVKEIFNKKINCTKERAKEKGYKGYAENPETSELSFKQRRAIVIVRVRERGYS